MASDNHNVPENSMNLDNLQFWKDMNNLAVELERRPEMKAEFMENPVPILQKRGLDVEVERTVDGKGVRISDQLNALGPHERTNAAEFLFQQAMLPPGSQMVLWGAVHIAVAANAALFANAVIWENALLATEEVAWTESDGAGDDTPKPAKPKPGTVGGNPEPGEGGDPEPGEGGDPEPGEGGDDNGGGYSGNNDGSGFTGWIGGGGNGGGDDGGGGYTGNNNGGGFTGGGSSGGGSSGGGSSGGGSSGGGSSGGSSGGGSSGGDDGGGGYTGNNNGGGYSGGGSSGGSSGGGSSGGGSSGGGSSGGSSGGGSSGGDDGGGGYSGWNGDGGYSGSGMTTGPDDSGGGSIAVSYGAGGPGNPGGNYSAGSGGDYGGMRAIAATHGAGGPGNPGGNYSMGSGGDYGGMHAIAATHGAGGPRDPGGNYSMGSGGDYGGMRAIAATHGAGGPGDRGGNYSMGSGGDYGGMHAIAASHGAGGPRDPGGNYSAGTGQVKVASSVAVDSMGFVHGQGDIGARAAVDSMGFVHGQGDIGARAAVESMGFVHGYGNVGTNAAVESMGAVRGQGNMEISVATESMGVVQGNGDYIAVEASGTGAPAQQMAAVTGHGRISADVAVESMGVVRGNGEILAVAEAAGAGMDPGAHLRPEEPIPEWPHLDTETPAGQSDATVVERPSAVRDPSRAPAQAAGAGCLTRLLALLAAVVVAIGGYIAWSNSVTKQAAEAVLNAPAQIEVKVGETADIPLEVSPEGTDVSMALSGDCAFLSGQSVTGLKPGDAVVTITAEYPPLAGPGGKIMHHAPAQATVGVHVTLDLKTRYLDDPVTLKVGDSYTIDEGKIEMIPRMQDVEISYQYAAQGDAIELRGNTVEAVEPGAGSVTIVVRVSGQESSCSFGVVVEEEKTEEIIVPIQEYEPDPYYEEPADQGHEHIWRYVRGSDPTCGSPGVNYYCCEVCGEYMEETVPPTGEHNWEPRKGQFGEIFYYCPNCGQIRYEK